MQFMVRRLCPTCVCFYSKTFWNSHVDLCDGTITRRNKKRKRYSKECNIEGYDKYGFLKITKFKSLENVHDLLDTCPLKFREHKYENFEDMYLDISRFCGGVKLSKEFTSKNWDIDLSDNAIHERYRIKPLLTDEQCENLRSHSTDYLDFTGWKLVCKSVALYDVNNLKMPTFVYSMESDVPELKEDMHGESLGVFFRNYLVKVHSNPEGAKLGTKIRRKGRDFVKDKVGSMYGYGIKRDGDWVQWNLNCWEMYAKTILLLPQALTSHSNSIIPGFAEDKKQLAESKGVEFMKDTFSTASAISFNYQSVFHKDEKDQHASLLTVLKQKEMHGGWLLFPMYKIAFPLNHGDVLIFDGKQYVHGTSLLFYGNTDINEYRIGYVMYL